MKIPVHYSLKVASEVVNKISIPKEIKDSVTLESWSNGREQGLCISVSLGNIEQWKHICVAQQRSSDDIIVISGPYNEFDITTNIPSDRVFSNRVCFRYDEQDKAAEYIYKVIIESATRKIRFIPKEHSKLEKTPNISKPKSKPKIDKQKQDKNFKENPAYELVG